MIPYLDVASKLHKITRMFIARRFCAAVAALCVWSAVALSPAAAFGQDTAATPPPAAPAYDPERRPVLPEPEFRLVNLPSNLRLPKHKGNFTISHRFNGNLRNGSFMDQLEELFGLDRGANIGIEYRYAVMRHVQAVFLRGNIDRTIQFSGRFDPIRQSDSMPVSISGIVAAEGTNNFRAGRQQSVGAVVGRTFGTRLALYATPVFVNNAAAGTGTDQSTSFVGIAGRARIGTAVYIVVEGSPRLSGYKPGTALLAFAIEKRLGGHIFQINFSNGPSMTFGQIARGGFDGNLNLGFHISRKFF